MQINRDYITENTPPGVRCGIVSIYRAYFAEKNSEIITVTHNGRGGVSNHQPHHCLLNRLFRRSSKNISKLHVTGL